MGLLLAGDRLARRVLLAGVHCYQRRLGWLLGGHCRFVPTCSCYAEEALQRGPLLPAVGLVLWRLARCQPLCRAGFDPVPDWMNTNPARMTHGNSAEAPVPSKVDKASTGG